MQDLDCLPQIPATIQPQKEFDGIKDVALLKIACDNVFGGTLVGLMLILFYYIINF